MATITLRNVPEALHERLKRRAERHRRSLNGEVLMLLEQALAQAPTDQKALRERIRALRAEAPPLELDPSALKRAMREGMP